MLGCVYVGTAIRESSSDNFGRSYIGSTDKKLKVKKPNFTFLENAKLKDKD